MPLNDPLHNSVPKDDTLPHLVADNRFSPSLLSPTAMAALKRSIERTQRRRSAYRGSPLRIHIDGEAYELLTLEGGVYKPFRVPLSATYMEIFGDDRAGDLLLGVFLFPEPALAEDDRLQQLSVTLEGGQMVTMEVAVGSGTGTPVREYVIQVTYADAAEVDTEGSVTPAGKLLQVVLQPEPGTPGNPRRGAIQLYRPGQ